MDRFFLRFVVVTLAVCIAAMVGYRLFFFTPTVQESDVIVPVADDVTDLEDDETSPVVIDDTVAPEIYIWKSVVLLNEGVHVTAQLPLKAFRTEGTLYQWTLPDAYLEKSRSMKLELFTQNTVFDAAGCFVSNDIERVTDESTITINGEAYCVMTGVSVGAGNVYRTTTYTKKDHTDPFALSFVIHYASDVRIFGGCETEEDEKKAECIAREFHAPQDTKLFSDIMETLHVDTK